jgi:hypothetical protein
MKITHAFILTILLLAITSKDKLTGRCENKLPGGNILGVIFKPDNSIEGYFNKKPLFTAPTPGVMAYFLLKTTAARI